MKTAARTEFSSRLYDKLASTKAGNLFLSPFSIQVALAMCAVGARGETRRVMADLIAAPENIDEQNRQYAELLKTVNGDGDRPFQLSTANALWGQQGFRFKPEFQEAIADYYDGAMHIVNFRSQPDEAVKTINAWVSDRTNEKIKDLVKRELIVRDTSLILTNAIYFKGEWDGRFNKANTTDEDWHSEGGVRKTPTMHQQRRYLYYEGNDFQALDLPYKGEQLSMLVVLPTKKDGLDVLESKWTAKGTYRLVTSRLRNESVILSLPRFKSESEFELKPVLCDMGAELAFSGEADFSGICQEPLAISEVVHKAFVEVNEEGTEAAAATAVFITKGPRPSAPQVFKADHPFMFFIRERNTNMVLFAGRLVEP